MKIKKGKYYVIRVKKECFPEMLSRDKIVVQASSVSEHDPWFLGRFLGSCKLGWGKNKNLWYMDKESVIREATNDEVIWESLK
jgi:hypothetical protein